GSVIVPYHDGISAEIWLERAEVTARGRRRHDIHLKQARLLELLPKHWSGQLPLVIGAPAFAVQDHDADRVRREGNAGEAQHCSAQGECSRHRSSPFGAAKAYSELPPPTTRYCWLSN